LHKTIWMTGYWRSANYMLRHQYWHQLKKFMNEVTEYERLLQTG